jgi:hypothetical protein
VLAFKKLTIEIAEKENQRQFKYRMKLLLYRSVSGLNEISLRLRKVGKTEVKESCQE